MTDMRWLFQQFASIAKLQNIAIDGIANWDTSNVTDMSGMFQTVKFPASFSLDLSGWNVSKVTNYESFADTNGRVTPPNFASATQASSTYGLR